MYDRQSQKWRERRQKWRYLHENSRFLEQLRRAGKPLGNGLYLGLDRKTRDEAEPSARGVAAPAMRADKDTEASQ